MRITPILSVFFLLATGHLGICQCPDRIEVYNQLNEITRKATSTAETLTAFRELWKKCSACRINDDSSYAKLLHLWGRTLWHNGRPDSALILTRESIAVNSKRNGRTSEQNLSNSYSNLGYILLQQQEFQKAIPEFDRAIKIGSRFPQKAFVVADSYCGKASIYTSLGDYGKTIAAAALGYKYALVARRHDLIIKSLVEKAQALIEIDNLNDGDLALTEALNMADQNQDQALIGGIYSLLAELKRKQNRPQEVIKCYLISFKSYKLANYDYGCGQAAADLAYYYSQYQSDYDKALDQYRLALQYMTNSVVKGMITSNIGKLFRYKRDFNTALSLSQRSLHLAKLKIDTSNVESLPPSKPIREALEKYALLSIVQDKADTWLEFGKATKNNNKPKLLNALKTYMLADTMVDYMRWEHTGNISKLFWRDKTRDMYERAIETCYLLNDPVKAFYFFEKSRAVMLNDQLNELGASQLLSAKDQENERNLKWKVTDLQNKLSGESASAQGISAQLFAAQEAQEAFIKTIEKTNPQYYAYKYDNRTLTLSELRDRILKQGQSFLSYFVGESSVYGLLVTGKSVSFKKIDRDVYRQLSSAFQPMLDNKDAQNKDFAKYLSVSSKLYQLLVSPFSITAGSRVIVSPDGSFFPFEALSKSGTSPEFLVRDYAFSYTYSAGYLAKSQRKSASPLSFNTFMGMAPVEFSSNLAQVSLPGSDIVLKAIEQNFLSARSMTGKDATRKAFVDHASEYRIVQLFTHAQADSSGTIPTLYFADSTLKLTELTPPAISMTELLILSACQTGIGKNQRGEGVFSLSRGFAAIGIPSTINTLWSVENESVYELTRLFYDELRQNLPLDVALQQAQIKWLSNASKSKLLPYSWAGMVIVGNTEPVETGIPRNLAMIVFGGMTVLIVFLLFLFRGRRNTR